MIYLWTRSGLLWGHILPYPKDGLVQPKTYSLCLARSGVTTSRSLRDIWQTDCKPSTANTSFVWLPFSANTITFTYYPLFELFFQQSYLKTTTWTNNAGNFEAYSAFEGVSSKCRIVSAKIHLGWRRNKKQTVKTSLFDWFLLTKMILEIIIW